MTATEKKYMDFCRHITGNLQDGEDLYQDDIRYSIMAYQEMPAEMLFEMEQIRETWNARGRLLSICIRLLMAIIGLIIPTGVRISL
mgnify:CR=1 FL=1